MKKVHFSALLISVMLFWLVPTLRAQSLTYTISVDTAQKPSIEILLQCEAKDSTHTLFLLPTSFGSQEQLYKAVQKIEVLAPEQAQIVLRKDSLLVVQHNTSKPTKITLRYVIQQDWEGNLTYPLNYRAIVQKNYIHLTGYALYVLPLHYKSKNIALSTEWKIPTQWSIANSIGINQWQYQKSISAEDLLNTIYVAGDFRVLSATVAGKPIYLAIRGKKWQFTDEVLLQNIQKIITAARQFWNDYEQPSYLVTLIPYSDEASHFNGSSLFQSFLLGMTEDFPEDIYVRGLLMHEYVHKWIGVEIQFAKDGQENAWFVEGFTEYYTYKLLHKAALITEQEYIEVSNRTIAEYFFSPAKNTPIDTLGKYFWTNRDYSLLPYKKGFVYALYLDNAIQKESKGKKSLDNLLFDIYAQTQKGKKLSNEAFLHHLAKYLPKNTIQSHFQACIIEGEDIVLTPENTQLLGKNAVMTALAQFEVGFDFEKTRATMKMTGVQEGSAAWDAGLREGQEVKSINIYYDQMDVPAKIGIKKENGEITTISYLPKSKKTISIVQFLIEK